MIAFILCYPDLGTYCADRGLVDLSTCRLVDLELPLQIVVNATVTTVTTTEALVICFRDKN